MDCRHWTDGELGWIATKKTGDSFESPVCQTSNEWEQLATARQSANVVYWPEPEFDVAAVEGTAFGTLKYPVAVDLLTLLITNSTAWRVPPV